MIAGMGVLGRTTAGLQSEADAPPSEVPMDFAGVVDADDGKGKDGDRARRNREKGALFHIDDDDEE
jgi:hypothetical protein